MTEHPLRPFDLQLPESRTDALPCWITCKQFSDLTGNSQRAAQKALENAADGKPWNGTALNVRRIGRMYEVDARTLPGHLYRKFYETNREALTPPAVSPSENSLQPAQRSANVELLSKQYRVAKWQADLIAPAMMFSRGTRGRRECLRALAAKDHIRPTDGKAMRFSEATLREFCARLAAGGVHALMRKKRQPEAQARCLVNRRWDSACPLSVTVKSRLAQEIEDYVSGLWAAGAPSRSKVRLMASAEFVKRCREAGWNEATPKNCDVGQYLVEKCQPARRVGVYHRDAKRFDDKFKPRIQRDRSQFAPGDAVVGDVHPVDIYLARGDGSTYTPRMIAWYDLATNRCFWTLVHCEPGKAVTQADVTRSFVEMCTKWGIPRRLYLDNGSEYSWETMVNGFDALAGLGAELDVRIEELEALEARWRERDQSESHTEVAERSPNVDEDRRALVRAKPYNAAAKPIEGAFSAKEKVFAMLPGYIGGNRMNKRVAKVGSDPHTYQGTPADFDRDFADAMAFFHLLPQRGHLNGMSPDEAYAAKRHLAKVTIADPVVFLLAFSEEKRLKVRTQGVELGARDGGRWYYDDALIPLIQTRPRFRVAKWNPERIVLVQTEGPDERYTAIHEARAFGFFDAEGAKEASRREGIAKRDVRRLKEAAPPVDLQEAMRTYVEEMRRVAPVPPPMESSQMRRISLSPAMQALSEQLSDENPNPAVKLGPGEFRDAEGVVHRQRSREEILRAKTAGAPHAPRLPEYRVDRPEPKAKNEFDWDEFGRKELEEVRRKKQSGGVGNHPAGSIQPFAVARTKKENEV